MNKHEDEYERGITIKSVESSDKEWNTLEEFLNLLDKDITSFLEGQPSEVITPISKGIFERIEAIKDKVIVAKGGDSEE